MKNKIADLRNHLFETLEALKDPDNPMPVERARAISDVAQTLINCAKVEIHFLETTGQTAGGQFFDGQALEAPERPPKLLVANGGRREG